MIITLHRWTFTWKDEEGKDQFRQSNWVSASTAEEFARTAAWPVAAGLAPGNKLVLHETKQVDVGE